MSAPPPPVPAMSFFELEVTRGVYPATDMRTEPPSAHLTDMTTTKLNQTVSKSNIAMLLFCIEPLSSLGEFSFCCYIKPTFREVMHNSYYSKEK